MKRSKKYFLFTSALTFFILLFFSSCKKDRPAPTPPDLGYAYFPLNLGSWIIYDVDSIVHDDYKDSVLTYSYQVKELVESNYTDNSGKEIYRIERYKRSTPSSDWIISDVWAATRNASRAEKFEENTWYVKLIFPIKENAKWNGNAFNSQETMEYNYTEINVSDSVNGHNFDSTLSVLQNDESNAILKLYAEERFAKNVGMIYKEYVNLKLDPLKGPVSGLDFTMKINSYGNK